MNIAKFLMLLAVLLPEIAIPAAAEPLLEQLRLDHAAWSTAERDFRARRESGALVGAEASDYAAYVARLQRRVAEDCAALSDAGVPAPEDMSCPQFETVVATRAVAIDQAAEQSRDERIASLDVELASGLADFDELLLREQERVKAAAPRSASGGGMGGGTDAVGHGGDGNGGGEGSAGEDRKAGETGVGGASTTDGDRSQAGGGADRSSTGAGGAPGRTSRSGATRQPPGIPDGRDDDVVARQLREAAEKETDPELQKKLWEEYRKYKQGTR
ncbi:MAG: hypothetical protein WCH04_01265 [Gammaproteobacteria bacterium]